MIDRIFSVISWLFGVLVTIAIVIAIAVILDIGIDKVDEYTATQKFNNGICTECGGHYVFVQAIGHYFGSDYMYECDQCGKHIEIPKYK